MPEYTHVVTSPLTEGGKPVNIMTSYRSDKPLPLAYPAPKDEKYSLRAEEIDGEMKAVPYVSRSVMTDLGFAIMAEVPFHELDEYDIV